MHLTTDEGIKYNILKNGRIYLSRYKENPTIQKNTLYPASAYKAFWTPKGVFVHPKLFFS